VKITAVVEEGVIKLPENISWENGTVVQIEPVEKQLPTLYEMLEKFDGIVDDVPADLAANLDHYIHGHDRA
jgi:predicted DNA-binding antitoxin AbrB/MazE fold protein